MSLEGAGAAEATHPWAVRDSIGVRYFVADPQSKFPQGRMLEVVDSARAVVPSPDGRHFFFALYRGDLSDDRSVYELFVYSVRDVRAGLLRSGSRGAAQPALAPLRHVELRSPHSDSFFAPAIHAAAWEDSDGIRFVGVDDAGRHRIYRLRVSSGELKPLTDETVDVVTLPHIPFEARGNAAVFATRRFEKWTPLDTYPLSVIEGNALAQIVSDQKWNVRLHASRGEGKTCLIGDAKSQVFYLSEISPDEKWIVVVYSPSGMRIPDVWRDYEVSPESGYQFFLVNLDTCQSRALIDAPAGTVTRAGRGRARPFDAFWSEDGRHLILYNTALPLTVSAAERRRMAYIVDYDLGSDQWSILQPMAGLDGSRVVEAKWLRPGRDLVISSQASAGDPLTATTLSYARNRWVRRESRATAPPRVSRGAFPDGFTVELRESMNDPPVMVATEAGREVALTAPDEALRRIERSHAQALRLPGPEGSVIDAILMLPPTAAGRADGTNLPPLIIQTSMAEADVFRPDGSAPGVYAAQALAARGFAVLQMNALGDGSLQMTPEELPASVARIDSAVAALAERKVIDPNRVGLIGFSRPGYAVYYAMTNPGRTKVAAAIVFDSVTASYGSYVESAALGDPLGVYERQYGEGTFWQNKEAWLRTAPSFNVDRVSAPILFGTTGQDCRWSPLETIGAFRYTRRAFDYFCLPKAAHVLQRPREREAAMQIAVDWMSFWMLGREDIETEDGKRIERWRKVRADWENVQRHDADASRRVSPDLQRKP